MLPVFQHLACNIFWEAVPISGLEGDHGGDTFNQVAAFREQVEAMLGSCPVQGVLPHGPVGNLFHLVYSFYHPDSAGTERFGAVGCERGFGIALEEILALRPVFADVDVSVASSADERVFLAPDKAVPFASDFQIQCTAFV